MTKSEIRSEYLQKRKALSEDLYFGLSQQLADQFFFHFHSKLLIINTLHLYLPIEKNKEPNTNFILKILFNRFKKIKVVVPVSNFETNQLNHVEINNQTIFEENKYGIPEPLDGKLVEEKEIDIVIIPLLSIDQLGNRIGYGGGFYDRFLANIRPDCLKIGLSFFDPIDTIIEPSKTDIPMDFCITPNKIWDFSIQNS
ncbi:MAG: 5-formyltetrahydrofolate cyclo-ligase [Bacteroidota bacterium]